MTDFSVLIAIYEGDNPEQTKAALESIWSVQGVKPSEIVVVADGPLPTGLRSLLEAWRERIGITLSMVSLAVNSGLGAALNEGLKACRFDLVARMDADDLALPGRFSAQIDYMVDHPETDILGGFAEEMTWSGKKLGLRTVPIEHEAIAANLWACPLVHPTIMMRRSRVLSVGNYDPKYRRRQDYELWFRCAEKGLRFHNLSEPLLRYRFGAHTHKKQSPSKALEQGMIGYRGSKRLKMPLYQRAACFVPFARSLLPNSVQHVVYRLLKPLDPRNKLR